MVKDNNFHKCRSCYHHIGGLYSVTFFSRLIENGYVRYTLPPVFNHPHHKISLLVTPAGQRYFQSLACLPKYPTVGFACLDGTVKKPHLGGRLGEIILQHLLSKKLLFRVANSRALEITEKAQSFLESRDF